MTNIDTPALGYVDPAIRPRTEREAQLIEAVKAWGFHLVRLPGNAGAVHLFGPGFVNVKAASLSALYLSDLGGRDGK